MATLNDRVMSKLSAFPGTANDKQMAWLASLDPSIVATDTLNTRWQKYLITNGWALTGGTLQEQIAKYMNAAVGMPVGLTTYNDIQLAYWGLNTPAPPLGPNEHNLTVGNGGSAVGFLDGSYGDITPTAVGAQTLDGVYVASTDVMYIEFVGGVQAGTSTTIEVSGPNGVVTCSWVPASLNYRSIITPGLFAAMSTEVDSIITIEIVPT